MEGKETSPSCHLEESSILDLPSVCDLAECFLPPHSSENSEELFCSVDTVPSLPTVPRSRLGIRRVSFFSGNSTILYAKQKQEGFFPAHLLPANYEECCLSSVPLHLFERSPWMTQVPKGLSQLLAEESRVELYYRDDTCTSSGNQPGESNLPSAVPASFSAGGSEKANVTCYPKAGLCEPTEPNDAALSWMYENDSVEDTSVRKSLDGFYKMYCKKRPDRMDPTYEAASQCLSQKISEIANRDGTKYALRCLQMAQVVLNRDGCKIFPNHPTTACFSKPDEGEVVLEDRKKTPGLSDDILQFLLKQTQAKHSPEVSHEK